MRIFTLSAPDSVIVHYHEWPHLTPEEASIGHTALASLRNWFLVRKLPVATTCEDRHHSFQQDQRPLFQMPYTFGRMRVLMYADIARDDISGLAFGGDCGMLALITAKNFPDAALFQSHRRGKDLYPSDFQRVELIAASDANKTSTESPSAPVVAVGETPAPAAAEKPAPAVRFDLSDQFAGTMLFGINSWDY